MLARLGSHLTAVIAAFLLTAASAGAQELATPAASNDEAAVTRAIEAPAPERQVEAAPVAAGPVLAGASIAARADLQQAESNAASTALMQSRDRRGTTLMLVGGAAFLAGLLIGDDAGTAVALGGAIVGLYGLYLYLQ
jgi:hypothetical protein